MQRKKTIMTTIFLMALLVGATRVCAAQADHRASSTGFGVGAQYDTTHVYVAPADADRFVASFLATFGGQSTKQVVATVTPTPSSTTSQLLQTPVGTVSLFGFKTPIPYPFGAEGTGYLVTDMAAAVKAATASGADLLVATFRDPIGLDAIIQWPGGVNMQLYWHFTKPSYGPLQTIPENRIYISPDRAAAFVRSFVAFAHGRVVSDDPRAPGAEIGEPNTTFRHIRIESAFGKMTVFVTDGHIAYPYGREVYRLRGCRPARHARQGNGFRRGGPCPAAYRRGSDIRHGRISGRLHCRNSFERRSPVTTGKALTFFTSPSIAACRRRAGRSPDTRPDRRCSRGGSSAIRRRRRALS